MRERRSAKNVRCCCVWGVTFRRGIGDARVAALAGLDLGEGGGRRLRRLQGVLLLPPSLSLSPSTVVFHKESPASVTQFPLPPPPLSL